MIKEKLKEMAFLFGYFLFEFFILDPYNIIKSIIMGLFDIIKSFSSVFSTKEEKRDYKEVLVFLIVIEILLIVYKKDFSLLGIPITLVLLAIILFVNLLKVKKEGRWKQKYRERFIYKKLTKDP